MRSALLAVALAGCIQPDSSPAPDSGARDVLVVNGYLASIFTLSLTERPSGSAAKVLDRVRIEGSSELRLEGAISGAAEAVDVRAVVMSLGEDGAFSFSHELEPGKDLRILYTWDPATADFVIASGLR